MPSSVTRHLTSRLARPTLAPMIIRNVRHKGLRRLLEDDDAGGLPPAVVDKVVKILAFLQDMASEDELRAVPSWKAHQLTGDRKGVWSLFVTRNWRITFAIDRREVEIVDLDYEDYH
jgi:toxin HigB-1